MVRVQSKYILFFLFTIVLLSSCKTTQQSALYDPKEVAQLSRKLGIHLSNTNKEDDKNMYLYAQSSLWLGVKYRYGGLSKKGVDCSGLTYLLYKDVYNKTIPRSTSDLSTMRMHNVSKNSLKAGDLVFFATTGDKKKISHVGIYLKDGYFIHASTSRGVVVDHLDTGYYSKNWRKGGRVR